MVDWGEVERRLAGLPEAKQAAGLRLIQALAEGRRVSTASGAGAEAAGEARARGGPTIGSRLVLAFASLQVVYWLFVFVRSLSEPAAGWIFLVPLVYIGASVVLARAARQDSRALSLAGFFLIMASSALSHFPSVLGPSFSGWWPAVLAMHLSLPEAFLPFLLWSFSREFPRVLRLDRWAPLIQVAVWTSGVLGLVLFSVNAFAELVGLASRSHLKLQYYSNLSLFLLCLPVPYVALKRSQQASDAEWRRVRWLLLGLVFWLVPWGELWLVLSSAGTVLPVPVPVRGYLQLLAVPLMTYAVIARRLPDGTLRTAARLASSRGAALGLAMLLTAQLLLRLLEQLLELLTEEDRRWIVEADPELIVPLASSRGETVALFVLGPKRSGLFYTRDEQQAITAFAAAASLALENVAGLGDRAWGLNVAEEPAGECRRCGHVALRAEGLCACRRPLAPAAMPYEFAGKFRLARVLGEGGMGVVYRATDLALGRQVALKTLPRLGSEALQRLRREARSMAGFLHPNLALIFGAETWRGVPILVVEYLAGGSLASRLGEPMAPREVLRLGMDLAGALEAMHDKGLLHRDVKPSNIGFTGGGVPKLLDFGLARLHEEAHFEVPVLDPGLSAIADEKLRLTLTGQVVGTPLYMAPEALAGALPSPAHDLWSLHLVLWEALAGRHPFAGMSLEAAVHRMAREEIPDIRTARPDCPAEISSLLVRALHLNAHHRPATAGAVRGAFLEAGWTA